ncbi:MAG: substrate-binding domain-containing protein [candidate division KSB1 bacterium]|nr:substrate-binding domain-containing protein [candidate division KSB1 bacterium]
MNNFLQENSQNTESSISKNPRRSVLKDAGPVLVDGTRKSRKSSENIGVIFCHKDLPLSNNPFYSRVLEGIEAALVMNNYNLVLHLLPQNENITLPKMIRDELVDGLMLVGVVSESFVERISKLNLPAVLVDPRYRQSFFPQILIDNERGAFLASTHLIRKGHRRIGFISADLDRLSFQTRFKGYRKALEYREIEFDKALVVNGGLEEGYEHVTRLLSLSNPPTAIFSANDINAIYGYKAVLDKGLKIPDDISFIGFDDIGLAKISSPPLTTIRVYKEEMGSIAVRRLLSVLQQTESEPSTSLVPVRLVERDSVMDISKRR